MKYQIIATRGPGVLLVSLTRPKGEYPRDWEAFIYEERRDIWEPVGPEAFKFGYWDESFEEIDLDKRR